MKLHREVIKQANKARGQGLITSYIAKIGHSVSLKLIQFLKKQYEDLCFPQFALELCNLKLISKVLI